MGKKITCITAWRVPSIHIVRCYLVPREYHQVCTHAFARMTLNNCSILHRGTCVMEEGETRWCKFGILPLESRRRGFLLSISLKEYSRRLHCLPFAFAVVGRYKHNIVGRYKHNIFIFSRFFFFYFSVSFSLTANRLAYSADGLTGSRQVGPREIFRRSWVVTAEQPLAWYQGYRGEGNAPKHSLLSRKNMRERHALIDALQQQQHSRTAGYGTTKK